jgi:hypothetical protein
MRRWFGLSAVPLLLLAGCAQGGPPSGAQPSGSASAAFAARAAKAAEAWRASGSGESWRQGFVPVGELTVLPPDVRFINETKLAYGNGWFRSTARLSTEVPAGGVVRFAGGETLAVPLTSAAEAYRAIDKGDPPCAGSGSGSSGGAAPGGAAPGGAAPGGAAPGGSGSSGGAAPGGVAPGGVAPKVQTDGPEREVRPPVVGGARPPAAASCTWLTVTAAKLGTVQMQTNRGQATVPAWLFTVDGLAGPLARVAVAPSAIAGSGKPPIAWPLPATVEGNRLTYHVMTGCTKDLTPMAYEAEDVVVVGAESTPVSGVCPAMATMEPVTVVLDAPLGDRVVLDTSGQPYQVETARR